jgi:serine/threonine-protein kinase
VAIKVLHDRFARQTDVVEQFILEAKAASRIRHPNIIDVTDIGTTPDGMVFLVMEYLEGENLEERLRRVRRLALFDAVNIVGQVARGLGAAHELGIVHRDLKPANVFPFRSCARRNLRRRQAGRLRRGQVH